MLRLILTRIFLIVSAQLAMAQRPPVVIKAAGGFRYENSRLLADLIRWRKFFSHG